jgi:5'-deoxynucleotidase YfbR-like HD superfamily hydrolase
MWGLLHDASEAYMVDLPTPVKRQVVGYNEAEKEVMRIIASYFNLPEQMPQIVKMADEIMLATEARDLMGSPSDWNLKVMPASFEIAEMSPRQVMKDFVYQFATISYDINPSKEGTIDSFYLQLIGPVG